jgi:hypothetical protein
MGNLEQFNSEGDAIERAAARYAAGDVNVTVIASRGGWFVESDDAPFIRSYEWIVWKRGKRVDD